MARGQWLQTWMVVGTCFGVDHNTSKGLKEFGGEISTRETDLEEYVPNKAALRPQVPALILRHAQIQWSNWIGVQWGETSEVPSQTRRVSGPPWKIRSPRSPTFLKATPLRPKTPTEAMAAVAQPPNRPIRKVGLQSTCDRGGVSGRSSSSNFGRKGGGCETKQWGLRQQWRR